MSERGFIVAGPASLANRVVRGPPPLPGLLHRQHLSSNYSLPNLRPNKVRCAAPCSSRTGRTDPRCCCGCVVVRRCGALRQTSVYLAFSLFTHHHLLPASPYYTYTTIYAGSCWCHLLLQHTTCRAQANECYSMSGGASPTITPHPRLAMIDRTGTGDRYTPRGLCINNGKHGAIGGS
jgi:hypothetical protein